MGSDFRNPGGKEEAAPPCVFHGADTPTILQEHLEAYHRNDQFHSFSH